MEYTSPWIWFELTTLVVICTDCTGSCKSNYHTITSMTTPHVNCVIIYIAIWIIIIYRRIMASLITRLYQWNLWEKKNWRNIRKRSCLLYRFQRSVNSNGQISCLYHHFNFFSETNGPKRKSICGTYFSKNTCKK